MNPEIDNTDVRMPCDVCVSVNGDTEIKRVKYCNPCKAHICEKHLNDYMSRGIAAFLELVSKVKVAVNDSAKETPKKNKIA